MKLSILIPVCNVEKYIRECLDSAVAQDLKDVEIICIDDGSTDASSRIIDEYAAKDRRIKVVHQQNSGFGHTMNVGLDQAKGEYVAFLESDDFVVADGYRKLTEVADSCGADIIKGDYYEIRGRAPNYVRKPCHCVGREELYNRNVIPREEPYLFYVPMMNPMGIFRREFLERNHIRHNETPGASFQDMGFWFQAFCLAQSVHYINEPVYCYRKDNPGSSMNNPRKSACIKDEYDFMWSFLERNPQILSWVAPIYFHRLFGSFLYRFNLLEPLDKAQFLFCTYSPMLRQCREKASFSTSRFTEREVVLFDQISDSPHVYLTNALTGIDINDSLIKTNSFLNNRLSAILQTKNRESDGSCPRRGNWQDGVSIIIPVYNVQAYVEKCLHSILNQTYRNIEVLCVDDGSTDRSLQVLERIAASDERVKVYRQKNQGQGSARNEGLRHAQKKYVYFVDADDFLSDETVLQSLIDQAELYQCEAVFFDAKVMSDGGTSKDANFAVDTYVRKHDYSHFTTGIQLFTAFVANKEYSVSPCLVFLSHDFLDRARIRFFEGIIYEDNIFTLHCMLAATRARHLPKKGYVRVVRSESTMTSIPKFGNLYSYLTCYIKIYQILLDYDKDVAVSNAIMQQLVACRWQVRRLVNLVPFARETARKALSQVEYDVFRQLVAASPTSPLAKATMAASSKDSASFLRRGWKCYRENGMRYTIGNMIGKIVRRIVR